MDFELSKPQKLLQKSVREFLTRNCSTQRVRELMATSTAVDDGLWSEMADQGWASLSIPEDCEGMGLSTVDVAAVAEIMGTFCVPGPFISNLWASGLITASGSEKATELLSPIAEGEKRATVAYLEAGADWDPAGLQAEAVAEADGFHLNGTKLFVSDAESADQLIWVTRVDGDLALFHLETATEGLSFAAMPALDQTRKLYQVEARDVRLPLSSLLARGEAAESALASAIREATVAVCAEMVGGMQWTLNATVEYAKSREQFGRPIGVYQAVQHLCADMLLGLESSRSATYYAAWAVAENDPEADRLVSIAKAYCSEAAREVGNNGIQVHGGIGFTWEHDLQLYYKRAKSSELLFGDAAYHHERIARQIIDK